MTILVGNCFHWVGFHLVSQLLERGYKVDGIGKVFDHKTEHLSMFLGRNSSFSLITEIVESKSYRLIMTVNENQLFHKKKIYPMIIIRTDGKINNQEIQSVVDAPMLYGKWMPMTDTGIYHRDTFVPFLSDTFINQAVCVEKYIDNLLNLIVEENFTSDIIENIYNNKEEINVLNKKLQNIDEKQKSKELALLLAHYKQFRDYY